MIAAVLVAHLVGDYLFQTSWMADEKTKRWAPAVAHGVTYTIPFVLITQSWLALLVIGGTHVVIDRYRLAKYLVWAKNQLAPRSHRFAPTDTGMAPEKPAWLAFWLLIIADNTVHILINIAAVAYL